MKEKIKKYFDKLLDVSTVKLENQLLMTRLEEEKKKKSAINRLKNSYLSKLRAANLEIGRLKKQMEKLKKKEGNNEKNSTYIIDTNNADFITGKDLFKERM